MKRQLLIVLFALCLASPAWAQMATLSNRRLAFGGGLTAAAYLALTNWVERVQTNGSNVTIPRTREVVGMYVDGLIADGVWTKVVRHGIFAGDSVSAQNAPLKNGGAVAVSDSNQGFTAADYSQASGLKGNGTNYLLTNMLISSASIGDNDLSFSVYVRTPTNEASATMSTFSGSQANNLLVSFANTSVWDCNDTTTARASVADTNGVGMYVGSRTSTSLSVLYKDAVGIATNTAAGGARATGFILVFAANNNGTPSLFTTRGIEEYAISTGLTAPEVSRLTTRYVTLRTGLGR